MFCLQLDAHAGRHNERNVLVILKAKLSALQTISKLIVLRPLSTLNFGE